MSSERPAQGRMLEEAELITGAGWQAGRHAGAVPFAGCGGRTRMAPWRSRVDRGPWTPCRSGSHGPRARAFCPVSPCNPVEAPTTTPGRRSSAGATLAGWSIEPSQSPELPFAGMPPGLHARTAPTCQSQLHASPTWTPSFSSRCTGRGAHPPSVYVHPPSLANFSPECRVHQGVKEKTA
jgi:hypothetical protein